MKKQLLLAILLLFSFQAFACSCDWGGNFLRVAKNSKTIVKAKVIERVYHTENGKRFTDYQEFLLETKNNKFDPFYGIGESIKIEILELIRGTEKRKVVEIFSSDGADCRVGTNLFEKGKIYVMSIYQPRRSEPKLPNETNSDYAIFACSENWVEFLPETNEIYGQIKGRYYRKKARRYSYDKMIKKIT